MSCAVESKTLWHAIIVIAIFLPLSSCDLIDNTCKQTPNYNICVSILKSDPKSKGAHDVTGLALIMVNALKSKSSSAIQLIEELIKTKPELKVPLTVCRDLYKFIIKYDVSVAVEALLKGDPKFGEGGMNDAGVEINLCEGGFKSSSPISGVNKDAKEVAAIAAAIIRLLL